MSAYTPDDVLPIPQRRIRHITSLQVRNLTPFPMRDALAQTLIQPASNPLSLPQQPADDIDLTLAARRRRRVSTSSLSTVFNADAEDDGTGTRRQRRTSSKGSLQSVRNVGVVSGSSTIRSKPRTGLKASAVHASSSAPFNEKDNTESYNEWDSVPTGGQFVTHSQRALEKIVSSRLVESFITLTLPPSPSSASSRPSSPAMSQPMYVLSPSRKGKELSVKRAISATVANHRRGNSSSSSTSTPSPASPSLSRRPHSLSSPSPNTPSRSRTGTSSRPLASSSKTANFPSPPPTPPPRSPPHSFPASTAATSPSFDSLNRNFENGLEVHPSSPIPTPFYISPVHLPSTNPSFSHLDPEREFAPWANLSSTQTRVAIWGCDKQFSDENRERSMVTKGKKKAKENISEGTPDTFKNTRFWKVLEQWVVDLDNMEPLSADVAAHRLPSNTLIVTMSSGETFRIPPISANVSSRAPSPLGPEYNSDGEIDGSRHTRRDRDGREEQRRERETLEKSRRETRMKRSACWQDLVKIVNLQACIVDTKESLEEIVRNCNQLVEGDGRFATVREISEREEYLRSLGSEREQVMQESARVKDAVEAKRMALSSRRNTLTAARTMHEEDLITHVKQAREVDLERKQHTALVTSLARLRTALIQAVSFIFPIEPLSAPDLLFTILGAPLPIPISSSDPAPPLLLSSRPEVTEDNTATALGFVAQVVQLISVYLGKGLVYPVTCCGSRSVIKDPISAMMGPRIFPLYSKGVETYRFEYAVFLLNKDIEMLMMDRDLRAMDMRHTLPNLKNLLLTLTTGEEVKQTRRIGSPVSVIIPSGLQSPTRAISPLALENSQLESRGDVPTIPAVPSTSRKPTPFLSPLAAILRARYPSSAGRPTVKVVDEAPEPNVDGGSSVDASPGLRIDIPDESPAPA